MTSNNALQLVQLGQLVHNVAESAYKGLQNLGQTLPALPDEERKRALLLHLHGTRQRLLRLHVLIEWSNKAAATKEVGKVLAKARNHAESLRESADQLFYLNQELQASNVPVHDVHTAREVLQTGTFKSLPSVISNLCGQSKPNAADRKRALRFMDFLLRTKLLKEALPRGMTISSIGNGHVNMSFPGYYAAVLTLAEAPPVQADQVSQPGQDEAKTGHPQSPLGLPSEPQQQPGPDHAAAIALRTDAQTQEAPHQEKYRWRMLSFELLPSFEREVLTVEQQLGLQTEVEFQMWQAADLRAQHSMAAAQRAQQTQHGADTAQSGPSEAAPEPSQQPVTARVESSAREESSQPPSHDHGADSHAPQPGQDPKVPPHPLQVLHNVLAGIAGKLVLHEVHGRLRQMLDDKGRWACLLKLNAAAVLPNGIRCSYWLNIQTSQRPAAKAQEEEGGSLGKPPRPTLHPSGGSSGPSPAPALEFGLSSNGGVTVIPVPLLPSHSEPDSESWRLELDPAALNVQELLLQAAAQNAALELEALHHALQQQTSLANSGCTLEVMANPQANSPNLEKPSATGPSQSRTDGEATSDVHQRVTTGLHQTALTRPKSPLLVMSSRGADVVVVSVQLKTGYLRLSCNPEMTQDNETTQLLRQAEDKLASLQREMRLAPLEDPALPRGQALSQALAKHLSLLFFAVSQKACFAQLESAASQHGLLMQSVPDSMLAGFMDQNPTAPVLNPARCISLALPPTPMLQAPPHPDAYRPWVNLGQAVSQPPTQSLAPSHRGNPLSGSDNSASKGQSLPFSAGLSAHRSKAASSGSDQAPSHEKQLLSQPMQTRFSFKSAAQQSASLGLNPTSPAALRFYLLAELTQTKSSASWQCYLLTCSCTFRGVLQKILSCKPVPALSSSGGSSALRPQQPPGTRAESELELGDVVSWCHQQMTRNHILAELEALGIPYTEELALQSRASTPLDPTAQLPPPSALPPNKRQKLSHDTDIGLDASAHGHDDSGMLDQQQEAEQAMVCKVVEVHSAHLLRHIHDGSDSGSITIHIPKTRPVPGVWAADVHSTYLSGLPRQLYTSSASRLLPSQSTSLLASKAAPASLQLQSHLQTPSQSAPLPGSTEAITSGSHLPAQAGFVSTAGQHVSPNQHGVRVQSNLLQGATFTALLELITGIGQMQNGLRRIRHLMESQQQHLQQMLMHHQLTEAKLTHAQHLPVVKSETDNVLRHQEHAQADSAALAVKLEEQQPGIADGQYAGVKSEDADPGTLSTETGGRQAPAPERRRPPQRLAWHVVSSGVVQIAHVGLHHAVLEVRPPPPWSHAVQPKAEDKANNPDIDVQQQQPSAPSDDSVEHQPHSKLHTADRHGTPPVPFLTIHMEWKLTAGHFLDQHTQPEPEPPALQTATQEQPVSKEQPPSQEQPSSQGLPYPKELPPQRLPPRQPHSADQAKHAANAAKSEGQGLPKGVPKGIPKLRCCMRSEPELPWQVLQSFQDMADIGEEGLLLDALAVVAQPLAAVIGAISLEGCRAAGISPDQLTLHLDRPPYQLQLRLHQGSKPSVILSLRFMKGSITFIGVSALPVFPPQQTEGALAADLLSQQAGLPEKLQSALSEEGVFLPKGVSTGFACSPRFFALAHQHRVSAGFWVRNSKLAAVLKHLVAPY